MLKLNHSKSKKSWSEISKSLKNVLNCKKNILNRPEFKKQVISILSCANIYKNFKIS